MTGDRGGVIKEPESSVMNAFTEVNIFKPDWIKSFVESPCLRPRPTREHQERSRWLFHLGRHGQV
jgi:hypothetical protein